MLSRTERCSSEVSCVTMPICARRLSCVTCGDVLAVDQDAAALDVVEAQQQVHHRALARARAADQADLLARADGQRQSSITPRCRRRQSARPRSDLAARHLRAAAPGRSTTAMRARQRVHAVLHRADVLEQRPSPT
jgi:hypothetical protein